MKSLRLHGVHDLRLHDEEQPRPAPGESLLRVQAVGLCGSDLHWLEKSGIGDARLNQPLILGHEIAARVEGEGDLVVLDPAISCGKCESCGEGNPNLCPQVRFAGHGDFDGGLREFMTWPKDHLIKLPDSIDALDGVMLEPLGVAIHAVDLAKLRPRMEIGVFGCGPIGLLILQLALLAGARGILATDRLAHRVEAARSLGASQGALVGEDGMLPELITISNENSLDVVFEVAGDNPAVESAIQAVRPGGKVVLVGIPSDDRTCFSASTARRKGLRISQCRRMKKSYPRAIDLVQNRKIEVRSLVSHRFPLEQAEQAFKTAASRVGLKVIINF